MDSEKLNRVISRVGIGTLAAAMVVAVPFIGGSEGDKLDAYLDGANKWTICKGVTEGVTPGLKLTKEQCDQLSEDAMRKFMVDVADLIGAPVTPKLLAAHTSLAYNIGIDAYRKSVALRETNKLNYVAGCNAIMNWHFVDEKDCNIPSNNCYGIITRRKAEVAMCLEGVP